MCTLKRFDRTCEIISNKEICTNYFELKIKAGNIAKYCLPGQFFMIGIPGVFLRRPISVYDSKKNVLSFLYKVVGKGTAILSRMCSGQLQVLGPLGKGYDLEICKELNYVIVAGGTGIASLHFLAIKLGKNKAKKRTLYYGARSKKDLLCLDKFKEIGWKVVVSTEDGSKGYKGYITDILEEKVKDSDVLFACGPMPMLKKVVQIAKEKKIKGFVSLEEKMACGVGNCQGCAVNINKVIKMTCKDGPVFEIEEVEL
ncbi:MAG: dihydroorotate dehydrogenase electron transfer subunit [Endomicrobium sp.]|jgi:dihydroorotate dehydrogenase electron transfer subunit|nr:dihydroorotate dehydrogenase electron transfer subunit [Endomicrobium sp.]